MSLASKLKVVKEDFLSKVPAEVPGIVARSLEDLRATGIVEKALGVGKAMPTFQLENQSGEVVKSDELLEKGPLVLTYYRGKW